MGPFRPYKIQIPWEATGMENVNKIYTPTQVANLLGYKVASIYALISRHELKAFKSGRNRYITQDQMNDFISGRKESAQIIDYTR